MVRGRPRRRGRARAELGGEAARADGEEEPVLFPLGAPVEVCSDDSGFAGSFYEATVVGYQPGGAGYVVAYSTLSRSGAGGSPLRERVAAADVRSRPPPAPPRGFAVHEMVEAFHNDGWWAGVVCAVPPAAPEDETAERPQPRVYTVCFPTSRELLEFEEAALRPNRVFQGERWVPAAEAENGIPLFRDGSQVEVSRSAKTFGKYWSPAIILKVIGATSFLVQYKDVKEDGGQVTEILDSQYIRPSRKIIHRDSKYRFPPSSHVEVFHEGSWRTGAILEVLDNESPKKYVVKIKSEDAEMDDVECVDLLTVDHTQLRPKYNWYRGKWVRFLTEKPANRGPQLTPRKRPISAALASCSDSVELTLSGPCDDSEEIRDEPGSYLKEKVNNEDVVLKKMPKRKRKADKKVKEASKLAAISEEPTEPNNDDGKDLPKNLDPGSVLLSEVNTVTHADSRPLNDDKGSQGVSVYLRESSVADDIIPSGVPIGLNKFHQEDCIGAAQHGATEVSVLIEKSVLSIASALDNPVEAHVFTSYSSTQCGNKAANANKSAIIMEQGTSEEFCQQSSVMDDDANVRLLPSADSCEDTGDKDNIEAMVEYVGSCVVPTENVSSMGSVAPNRLLSSENPVDADHQENTCNIPETKHAGADGLSSVISFPAFKKFAAHEQHGISQQDYSSAMIEFAAKGIQSIENSEITQLSSISMSSSTEAEQGDTLIDPKDSEHTPMSKFVPSKTQGSCLSLLQRSLDVHESIMADRTTESLAIENLPFMKTSPMWEQIEAMEVFRNVPQRPNFHKFQQHVPELREGMALGLMLSFANLAESIRRLRIHDEVALFEEKMKGLSLLEADGFDVRHLRSRLETLLHIRSGCSELQAAIKELKIKSSHKETDDRHLSAQIGLLNMTVRHLELQAYLFRCITQSAISQKMNNASEAVRLKTEADTLKQSYLSAEQRFSSAAKAPW
ncbi:uncharacterized protein C2845_PM17G07800 [Panicum miliaceum]|uniref:Agenet domain-containing protein n=1 Tax=Panicum miliaceum TaxID=4540 RepID=A0A3L6Q0I9_PANMI|nr:uncharacterized protein C2845_PM17G07800 [Panicum miliaceum]